GWGVLTEGLAGSSLGRRLTIVARYKPATQRRMIPEDRSRMAICFEGLAFVRLTARRARHHFREKHLEMRMVQNGDSRFSPVGVAKQNHQRGRHPLRNKAPALIGRRR